MAEGRLILVETPDGRAVVDVSSVVAVVLSDESVGLHFAGGAWLWTAEDFDALWAEVWPGEEMSGG